MKELRPGLSGKISFRVEQKHLAQEISSGEVRVFATPMMVAGMEMAAVEAVRPALGPEDTTVGTGVDVRHMAPTPPGLLVIFEATLVEVDPGGKTLVFEVKAADEAGSIGVGKHTRAVVNRKKFEERAYGKLGGRS